MMKIPPSSNSCQKKIKKTTKTYKKQHIKKKLPGTGKCTLPVPIRTDEPKRNEILGCRIRTQQSARWTRGLMKNPNLMKNPKFE